MDAEDGRRLTRAIGVTFAGGAGRILAPLGQWAAVALHGPAAAGALAVLTAQIEITSGFVAGGFADALQRAVAGAGTEGALGREARGLLGAALVALLLATAVAISIAAGAGPWLAGRLGVDALTLDLVIVAAGLPCHGATSLLLAVERGALRLTPEALVRGGAVPLCFFGGVLLGAQVGGRHALAVAWSAAQGAGLVLTLALWARHRGTLLPRGPWERPSPRTMRFIITQSTSMALYHAAWNLDVLLLGAFRPLAEVGVYRPFSELARQLFAIRVAFAGAYGSLVAKYHHARRTDALARSYGVVGSWVLWCATPAIVLTGLLAPPIAHRLVDSMQGLSLTFFPVLLCGTWVSCALGLAGNVLVMTGHPERNVLASLAGVVVLLGLGALLAPGLGPIGVATAGLAATIVTHLVQLAAARSVVDATLPLRPLLRPTAAGVTAAALALLAARGPAVSAAVFAATFAGLAWLAHRVAPRQRLGSCGHDAA